MTPEEMIRLCKEHSMFSWSKGSAVNPWPIERAEGIYMYGPAGEQIIDFNSQLMSVNIGHGHPRVREAMKLDRPAALCLARRSDRNSCPSVQKLRSFPGNLNTFFIHSAALRRTRMP